MSRTTTVRVRIDGDRVYLIAADGSETPLVPEIDSAKVDATDEAEIARQIAADDADARAEAAAHIRGLRARTGLSRAAFASRLDVSVETLRNWEQGKRLPQGPARALLRIIDKTPDAAMAAMWRGDRKMGRVLPSPVDRIPLYPREVVNRASATSPYVAGLERRPSRRIAAATRGQKLSTTITRFSESSLFGRKLSPLLSLSRDQSEAGDCVTACCPPAFVECRACC